MGVTRTHVGALMVLLACTFACKGAGQALRVASVLAVATVRVAAATAAIASHSHARQGDESPPPTPPPSEPVASSRQCAEIEPSGKVKRTAQCGGPMPVQVEETVAATR